MTVRAIDLFAGAGGSTEGATQAGAQVLFAANHWPDAVAVHAANHPGTEHACQDLHQLDWRKVPKHDLLLASPACQGHSRARGKDKPYHDALRSTAWAVTTCLEVHRPEAFVVENVAEFREWELFNVWHFSLRCLGYQVTLNVLNALDFGVSQNRKRLFMVGHKTRAIAIVPPKVERVSVRDLIDWHDGDWKPVDVPGRSKHILRQWRNGRGVHGDRFLVAYHTCKQTGVPLDQPIGTLTTKDQWGVVWGDLWRMLTIPEWKRLMSFPDAYHLPVSRPNAIKMLGNAVPPKMMRGIVGQVMEAIA